MLEHYDSWIEKKGTQRRRYTNVICPYCSSHFVALLENVQRNNTKSCSRGGRNSGYYNTPTYKSWQGIKDRCTNKKLQSYKRYGARGITYDPRWEKFCAFLSDMGECPKRMSIDRIDNNKGYSKANCRWATPLTQANNRRSNLVVIHNGKKQTLASLCREYGLDYKSTWHLHRKRKIPLKKLIKS